MTSLRPATATTVTLAALLAACLGPGCSSSPTAADGTIRRGSASTSALSTGPVESGYWSGFTPLPLDGGIANVATELAIEAPAAGSARNATPTTLHFSGARVQCRLDLRDAGTLDGHRILDVARSNGGWCDHALAGQVWLDRGPDQAVDYELFDSAGTSLAGARLQRDTR